MSHGKTDQELIKGKHNTARFFVETRQVAWVLLILTCLWGMYGYISMPQRKDPEVQVRTAVALVPWPGSSAEKVEQLVTKKVEEDGCQLEGHEDRINLAHRACSHLRRARRESQRDWQRV